METEAQAARTKLVFSGSLSACTASELSLSFCCMEPDAKLRPGKIVLFLAYRGLSTGEPVCLFTSQGHFCHASCLCSPKHLRSLDLLKCLCTRGSLASAPWGSFQSLQSSPKPFYHLAFLLLFSCSPWSLSVSLCVFCTEPLPSCCCYSPPVFLIPVFILFVFT